MATNVSNNMIELTRGDTVRYPLFINKGTDLCPLRYVLNEKDELYLGIMEPNQPFEYAIIKKKYTKNNINDNGDILIKLESNDTLCLIPGKYFYQIKLNKYISENDYEVITIIDKTEFWIQE